MRRRTSFMLSVLLFVVVHAATAEVWVELVLDASGSMFNRLEDGRYRITAAKEVLGDLVDRFPDGTHVGLRVYGSVLQAAAAGACTDSKLVVPLAGLDREALQKAIRTTQARGKTPIAYSLQQAANDFPPAAGQCLVILVTDGEEACEGDVRAAAAALSSKGCDVDLRIVGLDLDAAAVKSFEGLGSFENARSAAQLADALDRAVAAKVEVPPIGEATLDAPAEVGAGSLFEVRWQGPDGHRDYVTIVSVGTKDGEYGRWEYTKSGNPLKLLAPIEPGAYELRYQSDRVSGIGARRAVRVVAAEVALSVPTEVPAGKPFEVAWVGPGHSGDYLTLVPEGTPDTQYRGYTYTRDGNPARLHATMAPGRYEVRYQAESDGNKVLARAPLSITPTEIILTAPAEVAAGAPIEVEWTGPAGDKDYITLVAAAARDGAYEKYEYTQAGSPLVFTAPRTPGRFEIRYQSDRETGVFARTTVEVTKVEVSVSAPGEVDAGSSFSVRWVGPNGPGDYLTIVRPDDPAGTYNSYAYTRHGSPATLTAPDEPGTWEVRYQSEQEEGVFARQTVRVR